mmetsp:Transcript_98086/g.233448  ORF Transcript_98086/g.233448 Transcript_98086/m.233448 type:complete len:129 (-) Transcript_98086:1496-1882(-)
MDARRPRTSPRGSQTLNRAHTIAALRRPGLSNYLVESNAGRIFRQLNRDRRPPKEKTPRTSGPVQEMFAATVVTVTRIAKAVMIVTLLAATVIVCRMSRSTTLVVLRSQAASGGWEWILHAPAASSSC